jgi:hypothetical protein
MLAHLNWRCARFGFICILEENLHGQAAGDEMGGE